MIGEDFVFNGHQLSEYDMYMYAPDNDQEFVSTDYNRGEITSLRARPNHYSITYSGSMILEFLICKDPCYSDTQDDFALDGEEMHMLRSWLESPKLPTELVVYNSQDSMNTHYYGVFTSVQPYMVGAVCYGLNLTFTCNAPYGYSDIRTYTCLLSSSTSITKKIMNQSAEWKEYLKPVITITSSSSEGFGSNEDFTIVNKSDHDKTMTIKLPSGVKKLIIDCDKKIVKDQDGNLITLNDLGVEVPTTYNYNFISTATFTFYWLSLIPHQNILQISTTNASHSIAKVEISMQFILKSGGV